MKSLGDVRLAINEWFVSEGINVAPDVVPPQGDVGSYAVTYHANVGGGASSLSLAETTVRVYVSRAHEESGHLDADGVQSTLHESLEAWGGPWYRLIVTGSSVAEEVLADATYVVVRFAVEIYL